MVIALFVIIGGVLYVGWRFAVRYTDTALQVASKYLEQRDADFTGALEKQGTTFKDTCKAQAQAFQESMKMERETHRAICEMQQEALRAITAEIKSLTRKVDQLQGRKVS